MASLQLDVRDPGPKVTVEATPWYLALLAVIAVVSIGIFLFIRRNGERDQKV